MGYGKKSAGGMGGKGISGKKPTRGSMGGLKGVTFTKRISK